MTRTKATAVGFIAVLLWALLALFTVGSAPVPPLQLTAMSFAVGGALGLVWALATGGLHRLRGVAWSVYAFGTVGLFGYHFFYFSALRLAPPAQAGLIAYLWPLVIVLLSSLLPGERLGAGHLLGAAMGFAGAALIILGDGAQLTGGALPGYALALVCAVFWSSYSVISRRLAHAPTEAVAVFCIATAVLSAIAHVALEDTVLPTSGLAWASVLALGVGPVGLAFYVWDIGVKRGDIQLLGVASYAAPLLSTLALVLAGLAAPTPRLGLAAALITGGAVLAAWASRRAGRISSSPSGA
ncbi:DMT family transporter [Tropicimonas isoalkanivorans]|uniref:EamA domain-containing membrane protein RarD n=1 Tax=Tropicimonas isoalkanivorans TaxID=441112 RepID=A0A1I1N4C1_9RHOB|nr:DMT family transporter [Tropicimonas isoalkanivorans]SFC92487.1 EamA domain-containing membrane protein RarD [Tropicimonas isoalkanivorans]